MCARRHLFEIFCVLTAAVAACTAVLSRDVIAAPAQDQSYATGAASTSNETPADVLQLPHIRVYRDGRMEQLIAEGVSGSATFRQVVDRLNHSDVVVYVRCQQDVTKPLDGYLKFVGSAAGLRYLQAHVKYNTSRIRQIALVGHELFHAAEIADAPAVVDVPSFQREYVRIGFVSRRHRVDGDIAYDTHAAIRAGEQILRELQAAPRPNRMASAPASPDGSATESAATGSRSAVE